MSERFSSTVTHVHIHTHARTQSWMPAAGSLSRPHTHSLIHTGTVNTTDPYRTCTHILSSAIWGAALLDVCRIDEKTSGINLHRNTINLDRKTHRYRRTDVRGRGCNWVNVFCWMEKIQSWSLSCFLHSVHQITGSFQLWERESAHTQRQPIHFPSSCICSCRPSLPLSASSLPPSSEILGKVPVTLSSAPSLFLLAFLYWVEVAHLVCVCVCETVCKWVKENVCPFLIAPWVLKVVCESCVTKYNNRQ